MSATVTRPTISTFSVTKGGRVSETYACFTAWDLERSLDENLGRLRRENSIVARTDAWLKEMRRIFHVRFGDIDRHRPLIRLTQGPRALSQENWAPILLWHLCFRELLLSDFLESWLYPRKQEGLLRVRTADVRRYLAELEPRGLLQSPWSVNTVGRMASGLPTYAADFGLLKGKTAKEIAPFHPSREVFLYVLHDLASETASAEKILEDRRWRRLLLSRAEVEHELLHLHQLRGLRFEMAGSLLSLELPYKSVDEYVDYLVR